MKKYLFGIFMIPLVCFVVPANNPVKPTKVNLATKPSNNNAVIEKSLNDNLSKIGFSRIKNIKSQADKYFSDYYKSAYGLNFISETGVNEILEKEKLLFGPSTSYVNEIPLDVLKTIDANYRKAESEFYLYNFQYYSGGIIQMSGKDLLIKPSSGEQMNDINISRTITRAAIKKYYLNPKSDFVKLYFNNNPVQIVAPSKHFDVTGMTITKDQRLVSLHADPIALMKVEGGWLELAHW